MAYTTLWLIIGGACFVIEVFTVGFLMFFPGVGAFLAFIAALLDASIYTQVVIFVVSTILMILFARPMMTRIFKTKKSQPMHSSSLVGKTGTVLKKITGEHPIGQVKVAGEVWSAISESKDVLEPDTKVIIKSVTGVKLVVDKKEI